VGDQDDEATIQSKWLDAFKGEFFMSINLTQSEKIEMKDKANIGTILWIRDKVLRGREEEDWESNVDTQVTKGLGVVVKKT